MSTTCKWNYLDLSCFLNAFIRTCDVSQAGSTNSYRPILIGQCTNVYFGTYTLLTAISIDSYALLWNCTDATCSQCSNALTLATDVCAPDELNIGYSFSLSPTRCFGSLTNKANISSTSITVVFANNTQDCANFTHVDLITFGTPTVGTPLCLQYTNSSYAQLTLNANGTFTGGVWCNTGCSLCNQTFYGLAQNSCMAGSLGVSSVIILPTSALLTCYSSPQTYYLSFLNDP